MTKIFYNNKLVKINKADIYNETTKTVILNENNSSEEKLTFFDLMNNIINKSNTFTDDKLYLENLYILLFQIGDYYHYYKCGQK